MDVRMKEYLVMMKDPVRICIEVTTNTELGFVETKTSNLVDCNQLGANQGTESCQLTSTDQWRGLEQKRLRARSCANIIEKCHPYLGSWDCFNSSSSLSIRLIYCPRHHHHHHYHSAARRLSSTFQLSLLMTTILDSVWDKEIPWSLTVLARLQSIM